MLAKRSVVPVYLHPASAARLGLPLPQVLPLQHDTPVALGDVNIRPFAVSHDAVNTFGFTIAAGQRALFLASDLGCFDQEIVARSARCQAIAIEANYDREALRACGYPAALKTRIRSRCGHLSNDDMIRFLRQAIQPWTADVFLLHLSANSNSHAHVQRQIDTHLSERFPHVHFHISYRDQPLPIIEI
jgi:phosphoribosyl 1,2-cyclic phosphodiesterase